MTEIRGIAIELWLFHCSPSYRIIRAFHLTTSQGGGTMASGTLVFSEEQLVVFCTEGSLGRHGTCLCECTRGSAGIFALSVLCSTVCICQTRWQILVSMCVTLPVVLLTCAWLAQVPAVLWGSLPDPAQARQPIYYPLCTDADCRAARAHLCQGHPVSQGRVRATAPQDSAFFQAVIFWFQD